MVKPLIESLADLSINLASGWLGVLLISPGFVGIGPSEFRQLLILNLPPAIPSFVFGWYLRDKVRYFSNDKF